MAWTYTAVLAVLLVCLASLTWWRIDRDVGWPVVLVLAVGALVSASATADVRTSVKVSLMSILVAASITLCGPLGATVVGAMSGLPLGRHPLLARVFNSVSGAFVGLIGALCYLGVGGIVSPVSHLPRVLLTQVLLPLIVANIAMLVVNAFIVAGMIRLTTGKPFGSAARALVRPVVLSYLGYGVIAFLLTVLWGPVGLRYFGLVLMVLPLLLAQWSLTQQEDERRAHERTVETLVAAVETRNPMTRGHSARVNAVAQVIGQELRLSTADLDALYFAALLHDIGLVRAGEPAQAVEFTVHDEEVRRILDHPARGVEMIEDIDFLREAAAGIRHHHERWDGRGYPEGLAGEAIPLFSRLIAVSDTYCALLVHEGDHDAALAEISARSGSQLDPKCVDAVRHSHPQVIRALAELPDEFGSVSLNEDLAGLDHDHPRVSDQLGQLLRPRTVESL